MKTPANPRRQRGYVLLAMLLVFFVSGSTMMLNIMNQRHYVAQIEEDDELFRQMSMAKEALLAYAASSGTILSDDGSIGPGYLPCPDNDDDGAEDADCSDANVGRLPEFVTTAAGNRIHLNDYYADQDEQFWYAVSPLHLYAADNTDAGNRTLRDSGHDRLELDAADQIVALIIAPGAQLGDQNRGGAPTERANYLEQDNAESDSEFISHYAADPDAFNDTVLAITHDELMLAVGSIAANRFKQIIDDFHSTESDEEYPDFFDYVYGPTTYTFVDERLWNHFESDWFNTENWAPSTFDWINYDILGHIHYSRQDENHANISFGGCRGVIYSLSYENGIDREGLACE